MGFFTFQPAIGKGYSSPIVIKACLLHDKVRNAFLILKNYWQLV